ncbi:MAG: hypothetical protein JST66_17080 [Bacteroidetes bacterium]|nr:hypothetical protein [Bacteroidota bacterium]
MQRMLAYGLIAVMALPFVLTATIIVRFHLERDRIIREVCVQRAVPEAKRTCHGQCHLKKQLDEEQDAGPTEAPSPLRVELRVEPAITHDTRPMAVGPTASLRCYGPALSAPLPEGFLSLADPVPWC